MSERLGLLAEAFAMLLTLALAAAVVVTVPGDHRIAAIGIAVALVWSCASLAASTIGARNGEGTVRRVDVPADGAEHPESADSTDSRTGGWPLVTTIVRIGDEPAEIARSTVALAARSGATIVVTSDQDRADGLSDLVDTVYCDGDMGVAVRDAARHAGGEAVLLVSGRAVPRMDTCRRAASLLDDEVGWVTGTTRPFARDHFVSDRRDVVGAALRHRSVADLVLWESDATLVRRDLLADHELGASRSWGAWLRARASDGVHGRSVRDALSMRAAPVAAASYWPDALARQRAGAVDLAAASGTGRWAARLDALLLLLREMWAYPTTLLALCLVLAGRRAGGAELLGLFAALGGTAVLRWAALRGSLGVGLRPRADMTSAAYHLPGSFSALPAAITRRVRPLGPSVTTRPLVWGALGLTLVTGWIFISAQRAGATSVAGARVAAALCLVALGVLWVFAIRSLVERAWHRSSYRVRLQLPATIDDIAVSTVDGSPGGLAVAGVFPSAAPAVGDEVHLTVELDDGTTMATAGVVADVRHGRGRTQVGLELHEGADTVGAWSAQLLRAATADERPDVASGHSHGHASPSVGHDRHHRSRGRGLRLLDRLLTAVVVGGSLLVAVALVLVLLGFRPYVIRSGSMIPTYGVGDVVLVEQVRADQLRPGDVASLDYYAPTGEGLTHRIRAIHPVDGALEFETRGDANETSETWVEPPDAMVGKVVMSIPAIGTVATMARTATVPMVAVIVVLGLAVAALLFLRRPDGADDIRPDVPGPEQPDLEHADPETAEPVSADRAGGRRDRDERPGE